jgi:hypothetical protein
MKSILRHLPGIFMMLLLVNSFSSKAQGNSAFGFKAGINFSGLEGVEENERKNNFTAGLFLVCNRWGHLGLTTDLVYSGKGAEFETDPYGEGSDATKNSLTLHYIEMPVLLTCFFMRPSDAVRPKLMIGPSFAGLIGTQQTGTYRAAYSNFDLGAVLGAGLNIRCGDDCWLNLDARYTYGLLDINDAPGDISNRNLGITAGVGFAIGR